MKASTLISVVLLISVLGLSGCMARAPSMRMLDKRAEYEELDEQRNVRQLDLKEGGIDGFSSGPIPVRSRPKVASIWIHPHEMASHDYFWGGWMSVVVETDQWILSRQGEMPAALGIMDLNGSNMSQKRAIPSIPGARPTLKQTLKQESR